MGEVEKNSRDFLRFIEIILLVIAIILVIFLIIIELMHNEYTIYEREYSFNAYSVDSDENSVTVVLHHKDGSRIKTEETVYFEQGELVKTVSKYYYDRINVAKEEYDETMKIVNENLKSGLNQNYYTITKEANAVVYTYDNSEIAYSDVVNVQNNTSSKGNNEEVIEYVLENIDERYEENYVKLR